MAVCAAGAARSSAKFSLALAPSSSRARLKQAHQRRQRSAMSSRNALVVGERSLRFVLEVAQPLSLTAGWIADLHKPLAFSLIPAHAAVRRRARSELGARRLGRRGELRQRDAAQAFQLLRRQRPQVDARRVAGVQEGCPAKVRDDRKRKSSKGESSAQRRAQLTCRRLARRAPRSQRFPH